MTSVSREDIVNQALALSGARSTITAFTDPGPEAAAARIWYDTERLFLLRAHRWNFARFQGLLTLLFTAPGVGAEPATGLPWAFMPWAYAYSLPSDCAHFDFIIPTYNGAPAIQVAPNAIPQPSMPFLLSSIQNNSNQPVEAIFTNQAQAYGVWTRNIENPTLFDSQFVEAFSYRLAGSFAMQLAGSMQIVQTMYAKAAQVLSEAQARDGNEGLTVNNHMPDWIRTRGFGGDYGYWYGYGPGFVDGFGFGGPWGY